MSTNVRKSLNCIRFKDWCIKYTLHSKGKLCKLHFLKLTEHGLEPLECYYSQIKHSCPTFSSEFSQCHSLLFRLSLSQPDTEQRFSLWNGTESSEVAHRHCTGPSRYNSTSNILTHDVGAHFLPEFHWPHRHFLYFAYWFSNSCLAKA